jgi:pyruvate formate-lyase activating enzyme-like uncharacterized protein
MPVLSEGCVLCHRGAKMVLYITGRCPRSCWYCPLSEERKGKDVIFANERRISSPDEAVEEARTMDALGTGITGGEPLLELDRVVEYGTRLKKAFGREHHIHLYTSLAPSTAQLHRLVGCVDEIRMHPPREIWPHILESSYANSAIQARELGFAIGVEVPSLPGLEHLRNLLPLLDFININELEWSETNAEEMRMRRMDLADCHHNAVGGAKEWAKELLADERVHWCSSSFKDSVQLRERLKRIAKNTARPFDEVTDDGTVVYGVLEPSGPFPQQDPDLYESFADRIEMAWWLLVDEPESFPGTKYIVERYPNNGIIVEVTPL